MKFLQRKHLPSTAKDLAVFIRHQFLLLLGLILASSFFNSCSKRSFDSSALFSQNTKQLRSTAAQQPPSLAIPPLLDTANGEVELRAQNGRYAFAPGVYSPSMGYNGSYLGPTILLHKGKQAEIRVINELNEGTTLHSHGALIPGVADGGPQKIIPASQSWLLKFLVKQQAATLWYHPHKLGSTASQVWQGLAGVYIVQDEYAQALGLPQNYGKDDIPIIVQDRSFDEQGRMLSYSQVHDRRSTSTGVRGTHLLVNGQLQPQFRTASGWLRLRLLNGSNSSSYRFSFSTNGQAELPFYRIASEQGLLSQPEEKRYLNLTTGGRSEVMLQLPQKGSTIELKLAIWNTQLTKFSETQYPIMSIYVDPGLPLASGTLPSQLRRASEKTTAQHQADRLVSSPAELTQLPQQQLNLQMMSRSRRRRDSSMSRSKRKRDTDNLPLYSINDQIFDIQALNFDVPKGFYQVWRFNSDMSGHPVHIHGVQFRILRSAWLPNGSTEWRDTFTLTSRKEALVLLRFDHEADDENPYMLHCHMLEHEEAGMMTQFTVS